MPTILINDQPVFYAHHAAANAQQSLILIHGAGGSHLGWPRELRRWPNSTTAVYALDLPGHGRSGGSGHDNITDYANIVQALVAELELTNVILLGHSMGGAIAQTITLRQPAWLNGLILLGTGAKLPVSNQILDQVLADFPAAVAFINRYSWGPNIPQAIRDAAGVELAKTKPAVLYGDFLACNQFDVREQLGSITTPTLVISGEKDKMMPAKFGRFLAEHIPDAAFQLIDGAGHMLHLERPDVVGTAVQTFLQTQFS